MKMFNEKMARAMYEIIETGAKIWGVFEICDKHELNSGEQSIVIATYEESNRKMLELLEQDKLDELQFVSALEMASSYEDKKIQSLNIINNGFGASESD